MPKLAIPLRLIVGGGGSQIKMHRWRGGEEGGDYQDFLKWRGLFLGHSLIINELVVFVPKLCNLTLPQ